MTTTSHGIVITRIDRIAIHYSYIGWNSSDRKVVIVGDGKRYVADKVEVPAPLVTQLMASLTDLVPSDAPKSCDDHTDDYPIFDIVLATDQGEVHVSSSSNCRDFAPWNVVSGGVLYFQASGAFGRALAPMLTAVDAKVWPARRKIDRAPNFSLLQNTAAPAGAKLARSFRDRYHDVVSSLKPIRDAFPGALTITDAWCDTTSDPKCERPLITVQTPFTKNVAIELKVQVDGDAFVSMSAPPPEAARELADSALLRALRAVATSPSLVIRPYEDCPFGARIFAPLLAGATGKDTCKMLFVAVSGGGTGNEAPPSIFYAPALRLAWLRQGRGAANLAFYRELGPDAAKLAAAAATSSTWVYGTLDGHITTHPIP